MACLCVILSALSCCLSVYCYLFYFVAVSLLPLSSFLSETPSAVFSANAERCGSYLYRQPQLHVRNSARRSLSFLLFLCFLSFRVLHPFLFAPPLTSSLIV